MDKDERIWHNCLNIKGNGLDCKDCPVMKKGLCRVFLKKLEAICYKLNFKYSSIEYYDKIHLVSEVVETVFLKLESLMDNSKFSAWMERIYKNKLSQFFRKFYRDKEVFVHFFHHDEDDNDDALSEKISFTTWFSNEATNFTQNIIIILKENIKQDKTGCARLFYDLFCAYEKGEKDKDVAQDYGIRQNTFTKRKRRCKDIIINMIEEGI